MDRSKETEVIKVSGNLQWEENADSLLEKIIAYGIKNWHSKNIIYVISGAGNLGAKKLGFNKESYDAKKHLMAKNEKIDYVQNLTTIGQSILMSKINDAFEKAQSEFHSDVYGFGQVLFDRSKVYGKEQKNTVFRINSLLEMHIIPTLNNNDAYDSKETPLDNDGPAAQIAVALKADRLMMLSETDGFYWDLKSDKFAHILSKVQYDLCCGKNSCLKSGGNGGMESKNDAAFFAAYMGVREVFVGSYKYSIEEILSGKKRCTRYCK